MRYGILIAEDEMIERMMLKKILLKIFGDRCKIFEAENGKQALELFRSNQIHVVILDIEMPGLKGIDAAEIMRKEKEGFSIIFLTAYDKFEYAKKAVAVHALEYLLKPYLEKELVTVIEEALHITEKYMEGKNKYYYIPEVSHVMGEGSSEMSSFTEIKIENGSELKEHSPSRVHVLVSLIEDYVKTNYMKDISMQEAARAINYSETYFCKMFKQQYGQNFTTYLMEYRLKEAKKLLKQPLMNVKEVGIKVGYPDSSYFARVFRRSVGVSPSEYQLQSLQDF